MEVRTATTQDVDAIIELGTSRDEFQVSAKVVSFWPKNILFDCIKTKNNPIFVAVDNNQIIGFIISNYNPDFKKAVIENIFVKPKFREKSIGEKLLKALLNELKLAGCEYVCTLVQEQSNSATRFYLKNGFNKGITCIWLDLILNDSFKKR